MGFEYVFCDGLDLSVIDVVFGPTLVFPAMIEKCFPATTIRKLWKYKGFLFTRYGNYSTHLGPLSEVMGRKKVWDKFSAFFGVECGNLVFCTHSSLVT